MARESRPHVWIAPLAALILICVSVFEAPFWSGRAPVLSAVFVRLACCTLAACAAWAAGKNSATRSLCLQLGLWTAIGGAIGAAIACVLLLARRRTRSDASVGDWIDQESGAVPQANLDDWRALILDDRLRIEGARDSQSLCEVLDGADQPAKLRALSVIARRFDRRLVVALRTALKDSDAAVRVMAASVYAKLQKDFSDAVQKAQAAAKSAPDDPAAQVALVKARLSFIRSGLLSAERVREEREKSTKSALWIAQAKPESDALRLELAQLLLELSAFGEAAALLDAPFGDEFSRARAAGLRSEAAGYVGEAVR